MLNPGSRPEHGLPAAPIPGAPRAPLPAATAPPPAPAAPGALAAGAAIAGPGGRGAGPDHREAHPSEGMAAMINALRLLPVAPRTWDHAAYKAHGMRVAARPPGPCAAGRDVALQSNHFLLQLRASQAFEHDVTAARVSDVIAAPPKAGEGDAGAGPPEADGAAAPAPAPPLAARLVERLVSGLAEAQQWPSGWVCDGAAGRVYAAQQIVVPQGAGAEGGGGGGEGGGQAVLKAVVELKGEEEEDPAWGGAYEVTVSFLGDVDLGAKKQPPHQEPGPQPGAGADADGGGGAAAAAAAGGTAGAAAAAGHSEDKALRVLSAVVRRALIAGGGGSPAAVAAALAAAPPTAAAAAAGGGGVPSSSELSAPPAAPPAAPGGAAKEAPLPAAGAAPQPPSAAAAAAAAAAAPPTAPPLPSELPCVDLLGRCVCVLAPQRPELHASLGAGAEAWLGFSYSVARTQAGLALLLDLESHAFVSPGPLPAVADALLGAPGAPVEAPGPSAGGGATAQGAAAEKGAGGTAGGEAGGATGGGGVGEDPEGDRRLLAALVTGLQVHVALPGAPTPGALRTVRAVSALPASAAPHPSGRTVAAHFEAALGAELARPGMACMDVGTGPEPEWVPAELCSILPGQPYPILDEDQSEALARFASRRPPERRALLEAFLNGGQRVTADPAARALGLEAAGALQALRGRVLPPPYLSYGSPECMYPGTQGQWSLHVLKPAAPKPVASWACVCLMPRDEVDIPGPAGLPAFLADLSSTLVAAGMECAPPPAVYADPAASVLHHLRAGCEAAQQQFGAPCQLLLVLMRSRSGPLYAEVKMASDAALGLPSQCLVASSAGVGAGVAPRGRLQYCSNLVLSINAKLGGVNHRVAGDPVQVIPNIGVRPFVLFGAAVAQPPPAAAARGERAAAAVVASRDRSLGRYSSRVLLQPAGGAAIAGLAGAARELLLDFYRVNGARKPEAILLYRSWDGEQQQQQQEQEDGGQQEQQQQQQQQQQQRSDEDARRAVVAAEYDALRRACFDLEESYCPPITFILVSKRHTTRLFPSERDAADRSGNVPPGTVAEAPVTPPGAFGFYLVSQAGPSGHCRPAQYEVAVDESGFSADRIQLLTYWLSYLFACCTKSVSVAPPALYAAMAAKRGLLLSLRGAAAGSIEDLYEPSAAAAAAAAAGAPAAAEAPGGAPAAAAAAAAAVPAEVRVHPRLGGTMHYL